MAGRRQSSYLNSVVLILLVGCTQHPYQQGQVIYEYHCGNCHMADGSGLAKLIPPLDTAGLTLHNPGNLICLIRQGLPMDSATGQQMLPNTSLTDTEMTNLINFLGLRYKGWPQTVKEAEVSRWQKACDAR
jgi:hypothetical protein